MAKGTYAGLSQLKPVESKQGDIVSGWIDKYIAEGKAEQARKLKEMQEKNAQMDEFFRTVKIEPKDVEMKLTEANQNLTNAVTNKVAELRLQAMNAKTDTERTVAMNRVNKIMNNYRYYQNSLSSKQFIDGVKENRAYYDSNEAFDQSEQAALMNAYGNGQFDFQLNDNDEIILYAKTGDKVNDEAVPYSVSQVYELGTRRAEKNMLNPLYDDMAKKAKLYTETWERNPTGDFKTSVKEFVREKAELDFLSRYGNFDVRGQNNNIEYKQFAKTMTGKTIGVDEWTEEDHNNLKNLWVDKVSTYAPTAKKEINEVSADANAKWWANFNYKVAKDAADRAERAANRASAASAKPPEYNFVPNATIRAKSSSGAVDMKNGVIITMKDKAVVGFNVRNKNGKGTHTEYYNVGRDKYGRMAVDFGKRADKGDVFSRMKSFNIDVNQVDAGIKSVPIQQLINFKKGGQTELGEIKYDGAYKESPNNKGGAGRDWREEFQKRLNK